MRFELFVKMSGPGRSDIDVDIDRQTGSNVPGRPSPTHLLDATK